MKPLSERLFREAHVRLHLADDHKFQELVDRLHTTRSKLLRRLIQVAMGEAPDLLEKEIGEFQTAVNQVGAVGRNLNQLLRALNGGQVLSAERVLPVIESLVDAVQKLHQELSVSSAVKVSSFQRLKMSS